jgi:phosphopantetheine--protein transferase-like protein
MEEKIKGIVSVFIKVPADQIVAGTPIGRSALQSSILLHRMYARLAEEGVVVQNYVNIKFFGDLFTASAGDGGEAPLPVTPMISTLKSGSPISGNPTPGIGVDIEEIAALPRAADFRKEQFYTMNFTPAEIAYCILQPDPYSSLAGLFAAKEALIKADGQLRSCAFNTLEINHSTEGAPVFPGFALSISHAGGMAVAVATRTAGGTKGTAGWTEGVAGESQPAWPQSAAPAHKTAVGTAAGAGSWITWMALLLAIVAILVALKH